MVICLKLRKNETLVENIFFFKKVRFNHNIISLNPRAALHTLSAAAAYKQYLSAM